MTFGELRRDGLLDTGALWTAIPDADLRKMRLLAPHTKINEGPTWVLVYHCQWTIRSTYCNSTLASRSRWLYLQIKTQSQDKPFKPFDWSSIPTTQHYNTRYASGNPKFSRRHNAIEKEDWTISNVNEPILNPGMCVFLRVHGFNFSNSCSSLRTLVWMGVCFLQ